jgi:hypothetical protein
MEHKREDEAYVILHRGARSRGYKRREREREGEGPALRWAIWVSLLCVSPTLPACARLFSPPPRKALDIPFYRYNEMAQLYNGGVAMC